MKKDEVTISQLFSEISELAKTETGLMPVFDPSDFSILKTAVDSKVEGWYIGRWNEYKAFYALDAKMKGNGYMVVSIDGNVYMLPDWKNLENKFKLVEVKDRLTVVITDIIETGKEGETFVKCSLFKN